MSLVFEPNSLRVRTEGSDRRWVGVLESYKLTETMQKYLDVLQNYEFTETMQNVGISFGKIPHSTVE